MERQHWLGGPTLSEAMQITRDGRQRGRDDGLIERCEQHAEQQPGNDHEDLASRQRR